MIFWELNIADVEVCLSRLYKFKVHGTINSKLQQKKKEEN